MGSVNLISIATYMVDGVHGNTTSLWPRVALDCELVLGTRGLHERLVGTSTASDDTNHTTNGALDDLLGTRWELDTSLALVWVVTNNGNVVSGCASKSTSVANLLLHVGDHGTFRNGAEWEDVADGERCVLAGVDELASVHALVGDEGLGVELVAVRIAEDDLCERCTTTSVVDNLLHDTSNVSMSLCEIVGPELCRCLVEAGVGSEDTAATLSLVANNTTLLSQYVSPLSSCRPSILPISIVGVLYAAIGH